MPVLFAARGAAAYRRLAIRGGSLAAMLLATTWLVERIADVSILAL